LAKATPLIANLFASVPPEVKIKSSGAVPKVEEITPLAQSIPSLTSLPITEYLRHCHISLLNMATLPLELLD